MYACIYLYIDTNLNQIRPYPVCICAPWFMYLWICTCASVFTCINTDYIYVYMCMCMSIVLCVWSNPVHTCATDWVLMYTNTRIKCVLQPWKERAPACLVQTYKHTYTHACIHTCLLTYKHTYMHARMHTYIHTYIQAYVRIHACMRVKATMHSLCTLEDSA